MVFVPFKVNLISRRKSRASALKCLMENRRMIKANRKSRSSVKLDKSLVDVPEMTIESPPTKLTFTQLALRVTNADLSQMRSRESQVDNQMWSIFQQAVNNSPGIRVKRESFNEADKENMPCTPAKQPRKEKQMSDELPSLPQISGWNIEKRCLSCWQMEPLVKTYQLCRESYIKLFAEAKAQAKSPDPVDIAAQFELRYKEIVAGVESLSKEEVLSNMPEDEPNQVAKSRTCFWCGQRGRRKTDYCQ